MPQVSLFPQQRYIVCDDASYDFYINIMGINLHCSVGFLCGELARRRKVDIVYSSILQKTAIKSYFVFCTPLGNESEDILISLAPFENSKIGETIAFTKKVYILLN